MSTRSHHLSQNKKQTVMGNQQRQEKHGTFRPSVVPSMQRCHCAHGKQKRNKKSLCDLSRCNPRAPLLRAFDTSPRGSGSFVLAPVRVRRSSTTLAAVGAPWRTRSHLRRGASSLCSASGGASIALSASFHLSGAKKTGATAKSALKARRRSTYEEHGSSGHVFRVRGTSNSRNADRIASARCAVRDRVLHVPPPHSTTRVEAAPSSLIDMTEKRAAHAEFNESGSLRRPASNLLGRGNSGRALDRHRGRPRPRVVVLSPSLESPPSRTVFECASPIVRGRGR